MSKTQVRSEWNDYGRKPVRAGRTNRRLPLSAVSAVSGLIVLGKVISRFAESPTKGWHSVGIVLTIFAGAAGLVVSVAIVAWAPAVVRTLRLSQLVPADRFAIVGVAFGYWAALDRLAAVPLGRSYNNATLTVSNEEIVFWRGIVRPRRILALNRDEVIGAGLEFTNNFAFRVRLVVLQVEHGDQIVEVPLRLSSLWSLGMIPMNMGWRSRIAAHLARQARVDTPEK